MIMNNRTDHCNSLYDKLSELYEEGKIIGLSLEEAVIYGIDYADEWPLDESDNFMEEEDHHGES
jgi:hypothetical protein